MKLKVGMVLGMAVISSAAVAKGPTGIADLQLGMAKTAVNALKPTDRVSLTSQLPPYDYKKASAPQDSYAFDTTVRVPFSSQPLSARLGFQQDNLISIFMDLGSSDATLETVKMQITNKYGEPTVVNNMKDKQCIYRNGANFKLKSGDIIYEWAEPYKNGKVITTSITNYVSNSCPVNLAHDSVVPVTSHLLDIYIHNAQTDKSAEPNAF